MQFVDTRALEIKEPLPGWRGRFFDSERFTFGHYEIVAGARILEHSHPNEEVRHVIEGELEVTIVGVTRVAAPGFVAIVTPDTHDSVRARTNGCAIVVESPLRAAIGGVKL